MKSVINKLSIIGLCMGIVTLALGGTISAHVVVRPSEATAASFQAFTIGVPNEKDTPTTGVKLVIPNDLKHVSPTQKAGWNIDIEKEGADEAAAVKSITWNGNSVGVGFRDEFTFSAQVPAQAAELQWKAYQTYSDGTVVSWDKASEGSGHEKSSESGPFSVTKVVTSTEESASIQRASQAAADAKTAANRSLYIGIAGVVLGLLGIFLATRKGV